MKDSAVNTLDNQINDIKIAKNNFHTNMKDASVKLFTDNTCSSFKEIYIGHFNSLTNSDYPTEDDYILDVVKFW